MANWKRVLTEADLAGGTDIVTAVNGGDGLGNAYNYGSSGNIVTLSVGAGDGISVNADAVTLDLDGNTLSISGSGVKVADGGITNVQLDDSVISGQSGLGTLADADTFLVYDAGPTPALRQINASSIASYVATASGGDYDLARVNITSGEVAELQFSLDGTIEKRIRFVNQANETTVNIGSDDGEDAILIGLADDVEIDKTFEVNTSSVEGEVFRVHAHSTNATSSVFETDVTILGNLNVQGDTTETIVDTLNVEDSTFVINSDPTSTPILTGGMFVNIDNTAQGVADVLWLNSAKLSGWTVRNLFDYPGVTGGVELSVMDFTTGAPTTQEVFGAGSFMYDQTNNQLYVDLS